MLHWSCVEKCARMKSQEKLIKSFAAFSYLPIHKRTQIIRFVTLRNKFQLVRGIRNNRFFFFA